MSNEDLIPITVFCKYYEVEDSFINSLEEYGLIEIKKQEELQCICQEHIRDLERLVHLHYDLKINLEGIDAINHLLQKIVILQRELAIAQNKLKNYE